MPEHEWEYTAGDTIVKKQEHATDEPSTQDRELPEYEVQRRLVDVDTDEQLYVLRLEHDGGIDELVFSATVVHNQYQFARPDAWPEMYSAAGRSAQCNHQMHWDAEDGLYRCLYECGEIDERPPASKIDDEDE